MIEELSAHDAAERLRRDHPPLLVDVREDDERRAASIEGSVHIPMGQVPGRLDELPRDRDLLIHCHHGARSMQVAQFLAAHGYDRLANLEGGIDEWSRHVDPEVPRYP